MRHQISGKKLGRTSAHRKALFRNLVTALLEHEAIKTTDAKAKEVRRWADRLITMGKQGTLHARRRAASVVNQRAVVRKLFTDLAQRYEKRPGGYTRITKLGVRVGDAASMAIIELVDRPGTEVEGARPKKRRAKAKGHDHQHDHGHDHDHDHAHDRPAKKRAAG